MVAIRDVQNTSQSYFAATGVGRERNSPGDAAAVTKYLERHGTNGTVNP